MNRSEQKTFVKNLIGAVQTDILRKIDEGIIPADWDGIELRWLLADKFAGETMEMSKTRKRAYKNMIYTTTI